MADAYIRFWSVGVFRAMLVSTHPCAQFIPLGRFGGSPAVNWKFTLHTWPLDSLVGSFKKPRGSNTLWDANSRTD